MLVEVLMDGLAVSALLVVLALMGVQSALAFPRWSESREESHRTTLRWELENVVAQQALHQADGMRYATSLEELGFEPSPGVEVEVVASSWGWSATATHEALGDDEGCAVYVGAALPPVEPVMPTRRGEIACTE
ncbi:MAG: type II secretion system protein [Longimicrobiales bacterium]|nr:type II secretion system protein [Longimicrobiales bacterium]